MARDFFTKIDQQGFIEPQVVKQLFCDHCQRFLADRYIEGTCPNCNTPGAYGDQCEHCGHLLEPTALLDPVCKICSGTPRVRETKHWFFHLEKFQERLEKWQDGKTHWKSNVKEFCRGWFEQGLKPRAITRDLGWGVPVPLEEAKDKVLYVWFDAPIGYISSTIEWAEKQGQPDLWKKYWLDEGTRLIHFIGKDNIVFHALVWPATLLAYGEYILPEDIPANEFLNMEGKQLSTSKNWAVWLPEYLGEFPPDPLRYCIAANAPENRDADFTWKDFQAKNNGDLADVLGNFINRTLTFLSKYFDSQIPKPGPFEGDDEVLVAAIKNAPAAVGDLLETFQVKKGLQECMNLARMGNKYFNDQEPWKTRKEDTKRCATALHLCAQLLCSLSVVFNPYLPFSTEKLWKMLNQEEPLDSLDWEQAGQLRLSPGDRIGSLEILFPKIEDAIIDKQVEKLKKGAL
jgi:methionyl-tRNA synthetase